MTAATAVVSQAPTQLPRLPAVAPGVTHDLRTQIGQALAPFVQYALRAKLDRGEARSYSLDGLQLVISLASAPAGKQLGADPPVTVEVWPEAGPRLLVMEWSHQQARLLHHRDGDWVERLCTAARRQHLPGAVA